MYHVVNIMTKFGETHQFEVNDFITTLEDFTGRPVDGAIINTRRPDERLLNLYMQQKSTFVALGSPTDRRRLILEDLLETSGDVIRHDSAKLANVIDQLISDLSKN